MPLPPPPPPPEGPVRLTRYSHGSGCGCKIAPAVLDTILRSQLGTFPDPRLLVGYGSRDDAAVYDLGDGRALISTTDFFSPIVDDAFGFGRIAATNALSDVYAMGGTPLLALAVLGWPVEQLPAELASQVLDGGRQACHEAGIALAGGHSIDAPEPFFGLAVTGVVAIEHLKRNDTARPGDVLILTKPLGTGILSTALKRGVLLPGHARIAHDLMCRSNAVGAELAKLPGVHAMTDVTGFGLAGHLLEMCRGSSASATLNWSGVPVIPEAKDYLAMGCHADGALRNWKSIGPHVHGADGLERMMLLCDPQTSGGLLLSTDPSAVDDAIGIIARKGDKAFVIGAMDVHSDTIGVRVT